MTDRTRPRLPSGLVAFVKRDCPTCELVVPVLQELAAKTKLTVYSQDDPSFPPGMSAEDETALERSYLHEIDAVPTLLSVEDGVETKRAEGWHRGDWEALTGMSGLGAELPEWRPGCGSLSVDPTRAPALQIKFEGQGLHARRVELAELEDEQEALFERGWTDGLPVVPPTPARVLAMLGGTTRDPDEVVTVVPPDLVECTVEKVAINAVMAGCKPEYLPVVLAALEAVCGDEFNMHGVQATTMGMSPVIVVNGPIRKALGMNSGVGALAPGNRANSTIGRALTLLIRNVGGSKIGEIDRSTFGHPGKLGQCFPENEEGSPWTPFCSDYGVEAGKNAVTIYAGESPRIMVDQLSREPEDLIRSLAACLCGVHHPKMGIGMGALVVLGPEHTRVLSSSGWSKEEVRTRLVEAMKRPGSEMMRGVGGIAEGMPLPPDAAEAPIPKFLPQNLHIVHAGGGAGLFSMVFGGWLTGPAGSQVVSKEIGT